MVVINREKTDLEPRVPMAILRLFSVITLVFGCLGGVIAISNAVMGLNSQSEVVGGITIILGSIVTAAFLSVIASICDNLIEIRKSLAGRDEASS